MARIFYVPLLAFFALINTSSLFAQQWVDMLHNPDVNFYSLQQEFNNYWNGKEMEKGKGWKQFKRYENFVEPRVYPSGNRELASTAKAFEEYQKYMKESPSAGLRAGNTNVWSKLGPVGAPANSGAGRINFVRFHPTNTNTIYAGAPAGGLWVTSNGGTSWTTNTDDLTVIGNSDIAVDYTNPNIMYLATGDGDGSDNYSVGILKTMNGGLTWSATGLSWAVTQQRVINRLLIHPTNPNILFAGTSVGIYKTTDAGATWTQVSSASGIKDMEFKPGDSTTIYAASRVFLRSTDGGSTFTQITSGIPGSTAVRRFAIAVTPDDPNYVYLLAGDIGDNGFLGLYRSTNSGASFTTQSSLQNNAPNLLGWSTNGSDAGGQAWYDLAIAASPLNKNIVFVGGVNIWMSSNGGVNWNLNAHWYGGGGAPYVHADVHDLIFLPNGHLYAATDGGVYKTTNLGSSWSDISSNMEIAQMYKLGLSASNPGLVLTGHQDNGTNRLNNGNWQRVVGGDGMECFIDRTNNSIMFAELYYGAFRRSTNGGASWSSITSGLVGEGAWVTPWLQDPVADSVLYAGYTEVYKSTNRGTSWSQIGSIGGTGTIRSLAVAPSNNQVIYAARLQSIYRTTNGGNTWTQINSGLPNAAITYIAVHPTNPNTVYITFSGYQANNKVFMSTNGGSSWTNISAGLPNLPVNCIVYQSQSNGTMYVGTDVGVYTKDNTLQTWIPYFTGLPNVVVSELEIYYPTGKLRAATYGRGLWECDLFDSGNNPPLAEFTSDQTDVCQGSTVQFTDNSLFGPTNWFWSFQGGTPASSTSQNPTVVYANPGTYTVTLIATNNNGGDTIIKTSLITVNNGVNLPVTEDFQAIQFAPAGWSLADGGNDSITWQRSVTVGGFGLSTSAAYFNNFDNNSNGNVDELIAPVLNLYGLSDAYLIFDVAYAKYNNTYSDSLRIQISNDCGNTWTPIYLKGGSTLATAPDRSTLFIPSNSEWRKDSINLSNYAGSSNVKIKFENIGRFGNVLFVDNINLAGTATTVLAPNFTGSQTAVCAGSEVTFNDLSTGSPTSWSWSFPGGFPDTSNVQNPVIKYNTAGTYDVILRVSNAQGDSTAIFNSFITVAPAPNVVASGSTTICADTSAVISATGANSYTWSPGNSGMNTITVNPKVTTTYTVTGFSNGCYSKDSVKVTVNPLPSLTVPSNVNICIGDTATINASGAANYSWTGTSLLINSGATVTANPSATSTYKVIGTTLEGCTTEKNVTVTVTQYPVISFTPLNPSICKGEEINIQALGADSYVWTPSTGLTPISYSLHKAKPTTTTSYTVTGSVLGCASSGSFTITVFDPVVPVITLNGNILNTAPADSIQWKLNDQPIPGENGTSITLADSGNYTVTIRDLNGCITTSAPYYHSTVGISEAGIEHFNIYPNPNNGKFEIVFNVENIDDYTIEVHNVLGQKLYSEELINFNGAYQKRLNLSDHAKGTYIVAVRNRNGELIKRVVIF